MARKASSTFIPVLALVSMKGTPYSCKGGTAPSGGSPRPPPAPQNRPLWLGGAWEQGHIPSLLCHLCRAGLGTVQSGWHGHTGSLNEAPVPGVLWGGSGGCRFGHGSPWPARPRPLSSRPARCSRQPAEKGRASPSWGHPASRQGGARGGSRNLGVQGHRSARCPEENLLSTRHPAPILGAPILGSPRTGNLSLVLPSSGCQGDVSPAPPALWGHLQPGSPWRAGSPPGPIPPRRHGRGRDSLVVGEDGGSTRTLLPSSMMTTSFCAYSWISVSQACGDSGAASGGSTPHPAQPPGRAGKTFFYLILLFFPSRNRHRMRWRALKTPPSPPQPYRELAPHPKLSPSGPLPCP